MSTIAAADPHTRQAAAPPADSRERATHRLGSYIDPATGRQREIVEVPRPDGSTFVVDYRWSILGDGRLVAHLAHDEPPENARIVCKLYLADHTRGRCGLLRPEDFERTRHATPEPSSGCQKTWQSPLLSDATDHLYCIREVPGDRSLPELRWTGSCHSGQGKPFEVLTLREVVARFEDYEPARTITSEALAAHREDRCVSIRKLRGELERLDASQIVLNRGLRELVQRKVAHGELSMSEIALRCGRIKRDCRGNISGETSWLARRIGQLPEGGESERCPWVHSDVLALIARQGLGASPREVELN